MCVIFASPEILRIYREKKKNVQLEVTMTNLRRAVFMCTLQPSFHQSECTIVVLDEPKDKVKKKERITCTECTQTYTQVIRKFLVDTKPN